MRRWLLVAAAIAAVAAAWGYAERKSLLQGIGDFLVVNDPLIHADAVIIVSGNGPERVTSGVALVRDGYGRYLLVSGGPYTLGPRRAQRNSAWVMRDQAIAAGLPREQILMDDRAESTYENAAGAARVMRANGLRTAIVVTSPYHTRRAGLIFSRVFRAEGLAVRTRSAADSFFDVYKWWTRHRDRQLVTREYLKLLAAWGGAR